MYLLHVRVIAVREYSAAAIWYEQRSKGLGYRFLDELQRCFGRIKDNPGGFQVRKDDFRHAMVKGFPYRVAFKIDGNEVFVYQIRHTSRRPSKRFGP